MGIYLTILAIAIATASSVISVSGPSHGSSGLLPRGKLAIGILLISFMVLAWKEYAVHQEKKNSDEKIRSLEIKISELHLSAPATTEQWGRIKDIIIKISKNHGFWQTQYTDRSDGALSLFLNGERHVVGAIFLDKEDIKKFSLISGDVFYENLENFYFSTSWGGNREKLQKLALQIIGACMEPLPVRFHERNSEFRIRIEDNENLPDASSEIILDDEIFHKMNSLSRAEAGALILSKMNGIKCVMEQF